MSCFQVHALTASTEKRIQRLAEAAVLSDPEPLFPEAAKMPPKKAQVKKQASFSKKDLVPAASTAAGSVSSSAGNRRTGSFSGGINKPKIPPPPATPAPSVQLQLPKQPQGQQQQQQQKQKQPIPSTLLSLTSESFDLDESDFLGSVAEGAGGGKGLSKATTTKASKEVNTNKNKHGRHGWNAHNDYKVNCPAI